MKVWTRDAQPAPAAYASSSHDSGYEDEDEAEVAQFVAPKPPAPGTPSPEALARLQAAVQNQPRTVSMGSVPQEATQPASDKPRFGINSLINRMTVSTR